MKPFTFSVLTAMSSLLACSSAQAGTYLVDPNNHLALGRGLAPSNLTDYKATCIRPFTAVRADDEATGNGEIRVFATRNNSDLKGLLGVDAKFEASFLVASGSSSFNFKKEFSRTSESISIVIHGSTEYTSLLLPGDVQLAPEFQRLIEQGRMEEFEKLCGSEIVTTEKRGSMISVVITITGLSSSDLLEFGVESEGKGKFLDIGGGGRAKLNAMLSNKDFHRNISVSIRSLGGKGIAAGSTLAAASMGMLDGINMEALKQGVQEVLNQFTHKNAARIGFVTTPMWFGFNPSHQDLMVDHKEKKLAKLSEAYRRYKAALEAIDDVQTNPSNPRQQYFPRGYIKSYVYPELPRIIAFIDQISETHHQCLQDRSDNLNACQIPEGPSDTLSFHGAAHLLGIDLYNFQRRLQ